MRGWALPNPHIRQSLKLLPTDPQIFITVPQIAITVLQIALTVPKVA